MVARYLAAWDSSDRDVYLSLFADDATVEDPVGSAIRVGAVAIGEFWDEMIAMAGTGTFELVEDSIRVAGSSIAFMFSITTPAGEQSMVMKPIDVFEVGSDGLITAMRAYWGPSDLTFV